ncbi:PDZ and LIM domain protein Zasp isoform X5 [Nilaparvata lugens]|uniref:PDZ and LIM domain protein Zasp isoform X4 n=1 Tax=Nilaparvata lugens TaxID=108931 RepID=UPI00193CF955|nr:PDZ and LIM domain protein Zasp isoform X4 [Nilaparvata lugens]XP_039293817.1 PDZ and LIM domain protein Zasp isoform X5 [Nilaparvata lugens]
MASLINVRLNRGDASPWGFRLQGGKDFGTPLVIQKVNGNSLAEKAGLQVGDAVIRVNGQEVFNLRHKDAQDIIVRSGNNIEISIQRGGAATWKPAVQTVGGGVAASPHLPSNVAPVTKTSLAATKPAGPTGIGSSHNLSPRPFNQVNGGEPVKSIVNKQYNSPVNIYSEQTIAETLSAQAEVLAGGVLGVNFKKNERGYDAEKSEVYKMLQEAEREPKTPEPDVKSSTAYYSSVSHATGGRAVSPRPMTPIAQQMNLPLPPQTQAPPYMPSGGPASSSRSEPPKCSGCGKTIVGVFVRIKDKNLHVECFKCATCGSSLKNIGYYSINNKLYCDIHAKLVARQNPPGPNMDPITVPPQSSGFPPSSAAAPASPQSNLAPLPFHSSGSTNTVPKPFSSVQPPSAPYQPPAAPYQPPAAPYQPPAAPYQPPAAPAPPAPAPAPAPPAAAPFYNKPQSAENSIFARPSNQQDGSDSTPAAKATPSSSNHPPSSLSLPDYCSSGIVNPVTPIEEIPCCLNKNKRMSICSEEVCQLSEEDKQKLKGACLLMMKEESERPESPVPFPKSGSDSTVTTPQTEEMKSFGLAVSNMNIEEKREGNTSTKTLVSEQLQSRGMEGSSSSQKVEKSEDNGVQRTRTIKTEESFSHSSSSFSSVRASQSTRCITPEICEIMEKPFGSPSLLPPSMDRPTTPQQVISFPPDIPECLPQPKSRTGTPQPQPLQRILTEELGVKPIQPSLPKQEMAELFQVTSSKDDSTMVKIEELYTKTQVDEIVKKELIKYQTGAESVDMGIFDENVKQMLQQQQQQQFQEQEEQQRQEQLQRQLEQQRQEQLHRQQEQQRQEQLQRQQEQQRQEQQRLEHQRQEQRQQEQQRQEHQRQEQRQQEQQRQEQFQRQQQQKQEQIKRQQEVAQQEKQRQEQVQYEHGQMKLQHQQQAITQKFHQEEYQQKQVSEVSESQSNREVQSLFHQKSERSFSPVHAPPKIIRPKPQMVPLPPETKPYQPPPPPPQISEEESRAEMLEYRKMACQSPMVAALTVAPSRPFTPTSFQPIPTLDDLPKPPVGESMSLLSALTIAPDEPFHPFPKPVDVSRISPPTFQKWQQQSAVSQESNQKSMTQKQEQNSTSCMQQSQTFSCQKSMSCSKQVCERQLVSKSTEGNSAFKPMFKPQPLPLPEPITKQSIQTTYVPKCSTVSDDVKSNTSKPFIQNFSIKSQVDIRSISPSGLHKPAILPTYQQNIGDNSLPNRSKSPVPHKAPMTDSSKSQFSPRSSSVAGNIISSNNARARSFIGSSSGYVSSSVYGQTFTSDKDEPSQRPKSTTFGEASDNLLPYYQQNIGEIPLAHRPKSPVPHPIKAPSVSTPARASPIMNKPSPLAGKAPETLSKSKQVFKPEVKPYNNVFATPPEPLKPLNKTLPHFTKPKSVEETTQKTAGVPWVVKKVEELSNSSVTKNKEKTSLSSLLKSTMPQPVSSLSVTSPSVSATGSQKSAAGFTPPKPVGAPTTSVPPTGAGAGGGSAGNKGATFAGSTAPRRGRGTLNAGVAPGARIPLCGSCNSQIRGPFITALGKIWCPEHFVCANVQCKRPLQDVGFVEESSGLYCEFCFEQFLAPACNKCNKKIKGDCLNAIGKHFHPECFCCAYCGKLFGNSPFFLEDALPYCENDWNELFTTKCFSCGFPIEAGDRWVEALANNYHSQCFNCTMCKKNLEGQSFFAKGGRPFCKNHAR